MEKGKLYLIPTRLGDNAPLEVLPISIKKIIELVDNYIVENEKTARNFIKKINSGKSQPSLKINILNKFTQPLELESFLNAYRADVPFVKEDEILHDAIEKSITFLKHLEIDISELF